MIGATRGKVAVLGIDAALNQNCAAVKVDKENSSKFIYYFLESSYEDLKLRANSGGQECLNANLIKGFEVILPSLSEQIAIARILITWDEAIVQLSTLIKKKQQLKRALMQGLLTGDKRFAEFEGTPWRCVAIGDVLQLTTRFVEWDDDATYNLASVRRNAGGLFWRESLPGRDIKVKKLHTVRENDFLISHIQAAYGAMGRVPAEFDNGHVSDMYSILTPRDGAEVEVRFVDLLSQTPLMRQLILLSSNGFFAERLRLNFDPLQFIKQQIPLPPTLAEQQKIAAIIDAADQEIELLQRQLEALKTQKRGLMQRLLSGEVRVPVSSA
jgi:type I restriction enzyme S subunit